MTSLLKGMQRDHPRFGLTWSVRKWCVVLCNRRVLEIVVRTEMTFPRLLLRIYVPYIGESAKTYGGREESFHTPGNTRARIVWLCGLSNLPVREVLAPGQLSAVLKEKRRCRATK